MSTVTPVPPTEDFLAALGRAVVADGRLRQLQTRLDFSTNAMSELLYVPPGTYRTWIRRPATRLWPTTAVKIGRFYSATVEFLAQIRAEGIDLDSLVPLHKVAMVLGRPMEMLLDQFRAGIIDGFDLDGLGVWIGRVELDRLRKERHHVAA